MDYKNTLNLPRTDFPMKADLVTREPERLIKWYDRGSDKKGKNLYERIHATRSDCPKFVLHDGPPFANGSVHIGTALNKILKDIIIKYKTLRGFNSPYIPGWDCHGLPIEFTVMRKISAEFISEIILSVDDSDWTPEFLKGLKKLQDLFAATEPKLDPSIIRQTCEAYARKYIGEQRKQFIRLGVLGDWQNPYLTLNKEYEADELRLFADIVEKGFVYRGKKPVYWSIPCRTALAEAEVEYKDHVSQSVFVKFPVAGRPKTFIIIWTTTPWTLPANLAVAFHPKFTYVQVKVDEENFILFDGLVSAVAAKCNWTNSEIVHRFDRKDLNELKYQHPFCNRTGKLFPAEFVTNDTGTGFVHIAPGHGLEDYLLGQIKQLPIYSPVDDDGCFTYTNDLPIEQQMPKEMIGKSILEKHGKSDANEIVLHELRVRHALLHQENYHHSYPHCWRSKTPIIFRAMEQWFIRIDHIMGPPGAYAGGINMRTGVTHFSGTKTFREEAVAEIGKVNWIPDWGVNRIKGAVETRPDWCISRQRTWGVPLPAFYDANGEAILHKDIICKVADLIEQHGSNVWFEKSAAELWSLVKPKNWTGAEAVAKSNDTLDVWIDSGSSSRAVLKQRKELQHVEKTGDEIWQADVYLEGSDQHRGWFQSSLLLSLAGNNAVPFKKVLTHGFMVDADREKISKSKQAGYEKPQTAEAYVKKYGADIVRLWVASQDYRNDIIVSEERIAKVAETYRGIRNALRYQLSNLYDFDPAKHSVPDDQLTGLDRWILGEFSKLEKEVIEAYDKFEFHVVYQKVSQFVAVELSSVYHDIIKDRLYTDAANSPRRRSTQTALHRLVTGLCQMLAPILAFTADEAWEFVPGKNVNSVHESEFKPSSFSLTEIEKANWQTLFELRERTLGALEEARKEKKIGKSLDAKVKLAGLMAEELESKGLLQKTFQELVNVSRTELWKIPDNTTNIPWVEKADGQKCERCWHWEMDIGKNAEHPTICGRCVEAIKQLS